MYITSIHRNTGITFVRLVTTYCGKVKEKEKKHEKRRCTVEQKVRNKTLQWFVFAKKNRKHSNEVHFFKVHFEVHFFKVHIFKGSTQRKHTKR